MNDIERMREAARSIISEISNAALDIAAERDAAIAERDAANARGDASRTERNAWFKEYERELAELRRHNVALLAGEKAAIVRAERAEADSLFLNYLDRERNWSLRTFGPGRRTPSVIAHIRKELDEIEKDGEHSKEWVDVIILAIDGMWRDGFTSDDILNAILSKQGVNEGRKWPDWRKIDLTMPIEHDRTGD